MIEEPGELSTFSPLETKFCPYLYVMAAQLRATITPRSTFRIKYLPVCEG